MALPDTRPPETRRDASVVENLHGHTIADPYRWLEDPDADETGAWVAAQNAVSRAYLDALPTRSWFADRLAAIMQRPRHGTPVKRGGRYFVNRNDGRQNQDVWFVAETLAELEAGGRVIIDPNALSEDGTVSVLAFTVSPDRRTLSYSRAEGGSDWQHVELLDLETGGGIDDVPVVTKFCVPTWLPDGRSYFYNAWPETGPTEGTSTAALAGQELRIHRLGEADGELVLSFPDEPQLMIHADVTDDDRFVQAAIGRGTERVNRLWLYRVGSEEGRSVLSEPIRLFDVADAEYRLIRADEDRLIIWTDKEAPRGRVVVVDLTAFEPGTAPDLGDVVAEGSDTLIDVVAAGDGLITCHLVDAQPRFTRYALDGSDLGALEVGGGALMALSGKAGDDDAFVGVSTTTDPTVAYHVDAATGATRRLELAPDGAAYPPPDITVQRRRGVSKDGTEIPYFLITPAEHDDSRPAPTILWGYGGFNIPIMTDYRPGWPAWLAAGGVLAIANLRGGGEYGTAWYEAGRLRHKQNVFDDCVAVAEHLIATGVTTSRQLALHGRSNGGLLAGAVLTQHPELFAAVVPGVGVLDLLRFHRFTIGAAWISDYGNPEVAEDFEVALAYSPLHNVREGTTYPPTLVLTGDHDDRVVPLHSHKFTAALQRAQAGAGPVLARIETATGHGMGKPTALVAAEWTDWLAFVAEHTGLAVPA